jgi:Cdc6-like AAA superfamily ATPase
MTQAASPSCHQHPQLSDLLDKTSHIVSGIDPQFILYGRGLNELALRYCEGQFHRAVFGQFTLGKRTLINALTGGPILPTGVVPLTAVPTFLQYNGGRPANEFTSLSTADKSASLAGRTVLLYGPKGSGKSALLEALVRGMKQQSRPCGFCRRTRVRCCSIIWAIWTPNSEDLSAFFVILFVRL